MQDSLLSPYWFRVATLHPQLRPHVAVRMQSTRGHAWYVLHNQATGRHHRVNAQAYELVGRLDGRCSVEEVWHVLLERLGEDAPSQHDVIRILGQMTDAGLIQAEQLPDLTQMIRSETRRARKERRARLNPLSFRLNLFNPSALLERAAPLSRILWSSWVQWPWLMIVLMALWGVAVNFNAVLAYAQLHFLTPTYLAAAWLIYPLMKAVHEAGHALALRRYGCEVPAVGVNFFVFLPMPFVDASASNGLVNRWQRAHIGAAGIWVELGLAALAALLWLNIEDGVARQAAFVVMTLGGLSSLLFNGNPLMRLDAYYVMCDTLDLPNLGVRSAQWWSQLTRRWAHRVMGVQAQTQEHMAHATDALERWALRLYTPMSWLYRVSIFTVIALWATDKTALGGLVVAIWAVWTLLLSPLGAWWSLVQGQAAGLAARGRVWLGMLLVIGGIGSAVWLVPVPGSMVVEGVVWLPDDAQVRASADGEVEALWVRSQQPVRLGEPLAQLRSPRLLAEREALLARIQQGESEVHAAWGGDALRMQNAQEGLRRDRAALTRLDQELARHVLRAGTAGVFVMSRDEDLEGRQVHRGDVLAFVMGPQPGVIRTVIPQRDIDEVRARFRSASVMLDEQPGQTMPARWGREVPAATDRLPAPALADRQGGRVMTDPAWSEDFRPAEPSFVVDLVLDEPLPRAGGLARVKLTLAPRSLGDGLTQRARQLFLRHLPDLSS